MIKLSEIFPWDKNFETGIREIDDQHKNLVTLVNRLANHQAFEADRLTLEETLDELTAYTVYHFATEEELWHQYFPADAKTAEHKQIHEDFIRQVTQFRKAHDEQPGGEIMAKILSFLTQWLVFHILDSDRHMAKMVLAIQNGMSVQEAKVHVGKNTTASMKLLIETTLKMYDSLSSRTLQLIRESTQRQRVEQRLLLAKSVIDSTLEEIFITDSVGLIIDANPSFCSGINKTYSQVIGKTIRQIKPALFNHELGFDIWEEAGRKGHWKGEVIGAGSDGGTEAAWLSLTAVKDESGELCHFAAVLSSISQLIERQHSLEVQANHDILTGLPNRRLLHDRLGQAMMRSDRSGRMLAVCYLDLDGFKTINDSHGHHAGDQLLRIVSRKLEKILRGEDTVARLGGDEFILLLGGLVAQADADLILQKILDSIAEPVTIDHQQITTSCSIGMAFYPDDFSTAEALLEHADKAMYAAKTSGKAQFKIWRT